MYAIGQLSNACGGDAVRERNARLLMLLKMQLRQMISMGRSTHKGSISILITSITITNTSTSTSSTIITIKSGQMFLMNSTLKTAISPS